MSKIDLEAKAHLQADGRVVVSFNKERLLEATGAELMADLVTQRQRTTCAVLVNDVGQILPYTCQPTYSQCVEFCEKFFPAWEKMKELGCKIVQAELVLI